MPGGQSETFGYDAAGNLIAHTQFNGLIITNQYDAMNRLLLKATALGLGLLTNVYSASGLLTQRLDEAGLHTWIYDARGRLVTNITPVGTLLYTWDANGNQTGLKSTTPDGVDLSYEYDPLNRLTNVIDNRLGLASKNTAYGYDGAGNLATLRYPNGVTNHWQYDARNRLTNLTWKLNGNARADFAYRLDATGQRTNLSETVNAISRAFAWQFDRLHRLTHETVTGAWPAGTLSYRYDAVGNRLSRSGSLGTLGSQSLAYSVNDWLDNDTNPGNGSTYFDANGNTVSLDGTWQYDWANRLTNYNSGAATYGYDGDGNRIRKTVGSITTWYLVATVNPSGWPQVVEEHTGASPGALSRRYTYGHDLISQSRWTGSAWDTHFYLTDGLGSTRALLDSSGTITDTYVYDAFGTLIVSSGPTPNDYLFTGEQWDAVIGQYYLRARTLHPGYGRFWTMDTWAGNTHDPLSLHKYLYAHGNPVNGVDPSGNETLASLNLASFIISQNVSHQAHTSQSILEGARGLFGSNDLLDSAIYSLGVVNVTSDTLGLASGALGVAYGGYKALHFFKQTLFKGGLKLGRVINRALKAGADTLADEAEFYQGRVNEQAAKAFAASHGKKLLADTKGGAILDTQVQWSQFDRQEARAIAAPLSKVFAGKASGEVHAFVGRSHDPESIWSTVELPTLLSNPNVKKIILHDAENPNWTKIIYK